jgi:hypothetical protein
MNNLNNLCILISTSGLSLINQSVPTLAQNSTSVGGFGGRETSLFQYAVLLQRSNLACSGASCSRTSTVAEVSRQKYKYCSSRVLRLWLIQNHQLLLVLLMNGEL